MKYMQSYMALVLFLINVIIILLIFIFSFTQMTTVFHFAHSNNIPITKEKIINLNSYNYPHYEDRNKKTSTDYETDIIILDSVAIFLIFIFIFSFCIPQNECCNSNPEVRKNFGIGSCFGKFNCFDKYKCDGNYVECFTNKATGMLIIFLIMIFFPFNLAFFAVKGCGKHISKIVILIIISGLELGMTICAILSGNLIGFSDDLIIIIILSVLGPFCNVLGIILPNLNCGCYVLSYDYHYDNKYNSYKDNNNYNYFPSKNELEASTPDDEEDEKPYYYNNTNDKPMEPIGNIYNDNSSENNNVYDAPPPTGYQ